MAGVGPDHFPMISLSAAAMAAKIAHHSRDEGAQSIIIIIGIEWPNRGSLPHHNHDRLCVGLEGPSCCEVGDDAFDVAKQLPFPFAKPLDLQV